MDKIPDNIIKKSLYRKVKEEAKMKYKRYPSLYASAWINKEYQKRGGKYKNKINSNNNIDIWFREQWIQIIPYVKDGLTIKCGSNNKPTKACRPLIRINKDTPPTIDEIIKKFGKRKVINLAIKKNNDMNGRLNWIDGVFKPSKK